MVLNYTTCVRDIGNESLRELRPFWDLVGKSFLQRVCYIITGSILLRLILHTFLKIV